MKMFYRHGITASAADQDSWLCLDDATFSYTNLAFEDGTQIQTHFSSVYKSPDKENLTQVFLHFFYCTLYLYRMLFKKKILFVHSFI